MPEKTEPIRVHDVAPMPYDRENWTAENLIRHFAARAASLNEATRQSVMSHPRDVESRAFQRAVMQTARLSESASAHLAVAMLLRIVATRTAGIHRLVLDTLDELWNVTPEAGALNGEWVDAANEILASFGIEGWRISPEPCDFDDLAASSARAVPLAVIQLRNQLLDEACEYIDLPDCHEDCPGAYAAMSDTRKRLAVAEAEVFADETPATARLADSSPGGDAEVSRG